PAPPPPPCPYTTLFRSAGFLARSQALGRRCVLVVTGKGRGREESGVLRRQVPHWLNQPSLRARILAFDYARPEHGGMGALYLLLDRKSTRLNSSHVKNS